MKWNMWIRQFHRWLAIAFTALVLANVVLNFVVSAPPALTTGVGLATLVPVALLTLTGLYMFALTYFPAGKTR